MSVREGGKVVDGEVTSADSATGDPQVFYFGVFDGHGGDRCSIWLREKLHWYLEESAAKFGLESTLPGKRRRVIRREGGGEKLAGADDPAADIGKDDSSQTHFELAEVDHTTPPEGEEDAGALQQDLVQQWGHTVGGYFRRFKPDYFAEESGGQGETLYPSTVRNGNKLVMDPVFTSMGESMRPSGAPSLESVLSYSFLRADLDFITAHSSLKPTHEQGISDNSTSPDNPLPADPAPAEGTPSPGQPFIGGSTCSVALISTPGPIPFWHPASPFTLLTTHVGDTRIILCATATGAPIPLTTVHHPSTPTESARLRRYAASFTTDSFGEERLTGLANTRSFGDRRSKRVGVSAEPQLTLLHAKPAEFAFMVLVTDGVTGVLSDQEIVDVVKESRTPEQAAKDIASLAVEIASGESGESDNATCLVVRMGGWERRTEAGNGGLETREGRESRRAAASRVGGDRGR
jgi:protein phosphatase PTC6